MSSHFLIVLTKLGILKWKKRKYIESLFFDGDTKYISFLYRPVKENYYIFSVVDEFDFQKWKKVIIF